MALLAIATLLTACQCDDFCSPGLELSLGEVDDGALEAGEYSITVEVPSSGDVFASTCVVSEGAANASCSNSVRPTIFSTPLFGSPDALHEKIKINLREEHGEGALPARLVLEVAHDGVVLVAEDIVPEYAPQDGACDADCGSAFQGYEFLR